MVMKHAYQNERRENTFNPAPTMPTQIDILNNELGNLVVRDDRRAAQRSAMQELLRHGDSACQRNFFQPGHFTASAFILSPNRRELLLILHAKLDLWLQPGGHIEAEDLSPLAAARREAHEEVGIEELTLLREGLFDIDIHTIPKRLQEPEHKHFDLRYLFQAPSRAFHACSDAIQGQWVALSELNRVHSDASVRRTAGLIELNQSDVSR
jgi:8-oxo-dGTP pyrophosphatase MutT (NUDIX family)